jgi:predicted ATPase/DNA-binding CsgD family transcriptional regulator/transcriptional regulator with XRE-family HTH domain
MADGEPAMEFGDLLRRFRGAAGCTQVQLATQSGLTVQAISLLERRERQHPHPRTVQQLADALSLIGADRVRFETAARRAGPGAPSHDLVSSAAPFRPPVAPGPIIGRDRELAALTALLAEEDVRLVTLTGTGGVGKTRLALEVAGELGPQRAYGAAFVSLAALRNARFVPTAVAHVLGVQEVAGQGIEAGLRAYLAGKRLLLLLDNFEQVMPATTWLTDVLATCGGLQVLVTSRTALRLRGEREFSVQPLALPPSASPWSIDALAQNPAVDLFVRRAQAARPDFALTGVDATAIATIVQRLDGLPLAIELAAARVKVLPPSALLARLAHPLDMLVDGARDLPERQQTLRRTLAWSYELLDGPERALFRRLAVFSGGSELEAIEQICAGEGVAPHAILDLLSHLIDHTLVQADLAASSPRYWLLETTFAYATEQLEQAGETVQLRRRHRDWCLALAEQAEPELVGSSQLIWYERLQRERHNLRAALAWCQEHDATSGLRLAVALRPYWERRGLFAEGRRILQDFLGLGTESTSLRARALLGAGVLAAAQDDRAAARPLLEESLTCSRECSDQTGAAWALLHLADLAMIDDELGSAQARYAESLHLFQELGDERGVAWNHYFTGFLSRMQGDSTRTRRLWEQSLAGFRSVGDLRGVGAVLRYLAQFAVMRAEYAAARTLLVESLALERSAENKPAIGWTLSILGNLARIQGDILEAQIFLEESLALFEELGDQRKRGVALHHLGNVALDAGDLGAARSRYEASLALYRATKDARNVARVLGDLAALSSREGNVVRARALWQECLLGFRDSGTNRWGMAWAFSNLGTLAIRWGDEAGGILLLAAADTIHPEFRRAVDPDERNAWDTALITARAALGEQGVAAAWEAGRALPVADAIARAAATGTLRLPTNTCHAAPDTHQARLTHRELEVAALVARGFTSRQIAQALVVAEGTAALHVEHIREKLGFHSRAEIASWAVRQGLLTE